MGHLKNFKQFILLSLFSLAAINVLAMTDDKPNVIIILTDDQGFGDFGFNGNPHIKTPALDLLASQSIRLNNFYVSPVCAPTRSSIMTGRYSLRTGISDTYNGGATMAASEYTMAEMFKDAGYTTGIFGKWHLGDNYPSRPIDQGFDESVTHRAGGMGQVGDITTYFKYEKSYFDPVLWHNGKQQSYNGYCSDIYADEAIKFIEKNREKPFFTYLSFNAPHTPLQVPEEYYNMYKDIDPSSGFENDKRPFVEMTEKNKEDARKVYAMVTNIDDNINKLMQKLKDLKLEKNTIVIFFTDNGPQQVRYIGGMKGRKSSVYQGGVRVPFLLRYPGKYKKSFEIETYLAHMDLLPTLASLCSTEIPENINIDGKNFKPLLDKQEVDWAERSMFFYWTRRNPIKYNNLAARKGNYKLVAHTGYHSKISDFELFNIVDDPYEQNNILDNNVQVAASLKAELDSWYNEMVRSENLNTPQPAIIGTRYENPTILNRNDADGQEGIWSQESIYGFWNVEVAQPGYYTLRFKFIAPVDEGKINVEYGSYHYEFENRNEQITDLVMEKVFLPESGTRAFIPWYSSKGKRIFPFYVEIEKNPK